MRLALHWTEVFTGGRARVRERPLVDNDGDDAIGSGPASWPIWSLLRLSGGEWAPPARERGVHWA